MLLPHDVPAPSGNGGKGWAFSLSSLWPYNPSSSKSHLVPLSPLLPAHAVMLSVCLQKNEGRGSPGKLFQAAGQQTEATF